MLRMKVVEMDREALVAGLAAETVLLVDVREPHEFAAGHIPGSVSMPLSQFDPHALPDPAGRTLVFSCAAGVRSVHALAAAQAAGLGFDTHFPDGFKGWLMAGGPVAR
jgi:rhodanese-related sulfurtransferase